MDKKEILEWFLIMQQLPANNAYLRVKILRKLHSLGAISIKSSAYVLPAIVGAFEDLQWLATEIRDNDGDAIICKVEFIDGFTDEELIHEFDKSRNEEYENLLNEIKHSMNAYTKLSDDDNLENKIIKFRKKFERIAKTDFFDADGKQKVAAELTQIESSLLKIPATPLKTISIENFRHKIWVTRSNIGVDRIACAWLIKNFIDKNAKFKFVNEINYKAAKDELQYDMFDGEITHQGDKCSFEVLLSKINIQNYALNQISEIVHDIDLKDEKFAREEALGIATLLSAISTNSNDDATRQIRGFTIFDDLYHFYSGKHDGKQSGTQ